MQNIKLNNQKWSIDTSNILGSAGGFGEVFKGEGENGEVAIKRLKLTASDAAHRELDIGKSLSKRSLKNIVPILDYGQDAESDRYYIVMPICDFSLQDEINSRGKFSSDEVIRVVLAILKGLEEVKDITHRDLKPSNVLMHQGAWKIADFGIAKFVEDSTSIETLRRNHTPLYSAPEQWNLERPTIATDIYAVGCIVHTLITGQPPYTGDLNSIRDQHLNTTPPILKELPIELRSFVSIMMRKNPESRPILNRCIELFQNAVNTETHEAYNTDLVFHEAVELLENKKANQDAELLKRKKYKENRESIFKESASELISIQKDLFKKIKSQFQDYIDNRSSKYQLIIDNIHIQFNTSLDDINGIKISDPKGICGKGGWGVHEKLSKWDIVSHAELIFDDRNSEKYYKRSADLVFGRPDTDREYRWFEMAFWSTETRGHQHLPFSLNYSFEIDKALTLGGVNKLAHKPVSIDGEDQDGFIQYWLNIVAMAIIGKLEYPSQFPMKR